MKLAAKVTYLFLSFFFFFGSFLALPHARPQLNL